MTDVTAEYIVPARGFQEIHMMAGAVVVPVAIAVAGLLRLQWRCVAIGVAVAVAMAVLFPLCSTIDAFAVLIAVAGAVLIAVADAVLIAVADAVLIAVADAVLIAVAGAVVVADTILSRSQIRAGMDRGGPNRSSSRWSSPAG